MTRAKLGTTAVSLIAAGLAFSAPLALAATTTTHLPDMTAYNCAATAPTDERTITVNHLGQFVNGAYVEWNEFYATATSTTVTAAPQLICISRLVPLAKQLTSDEAKSFLTDSLAIGASTGSAKEKSLSVEDGVDPDHIQAEPMKRAIKPSENAARAQSTTVDVPPVPVTKSSDPNSAENTAPASTTTTTKQQTTTTSTVERALTVGVEDRTQVTDTTAHPFNVIGYLLVTYSNGASYRCTGTLVSAYTVMTAGHCVHNNNRGGFIVQAKFYPGQYQTSPSSQIQRPYTSHSDWMNLKATQAWTQISGDDSYAVTDYKSDYAAIQFKTAFTHTATFMPILFSSTTTPVTNSGYPATVKNNDVYAPFMMTGREQSTYLRSSHVREFAIDASGGDSGGPFWVTDTATGRPTLVGSLSYGDDLNDTAGGPWYDSWNQALITDWMSWTPASGTAAANSVTGLRVGSVFSAAQSNSLSYVRLYNPTATSGTVDITLADYATGTALTTWTSPSIPAGASLQYAVKTMETDGTTPITSPPAYYSMSVRPTFSGYFQHALWRTTDGTITDLSTCDTKATTDPKVLLQVHTSTIQAGYPSTIVVHNTGTTSTSVTLGIYDARNGTKLGNYFTPTLAANSQNIILVSDMEVQAHITPTAFMFHYVVKAETTFTGYIQHIVRNNTSGTYVDMSSVCVMTPTSG